MHPRRQIREDLKARLLAGNTAAQDRVFATMTPPIDLKNVLDADGPVIMLYVREETIKPEDYDATGQSGSVRRTLEVVVEALALSADADSKCDDLAEAIEALMEDFTIPSHPAAEMRLMHTEINVTDAFESTLGGVFMTYEVKYYTAFRAQPDDADPLADNLFALRQTETAELILHGNTPGAEVNDVQSIP